MKILFSAEKNQTTGETVEIYLINRKSFSRPVVQREKNLTTGNEERFSLAPRGLNAKIIHHGKNDSIRKPRENNKEHLMFSRARKDFLHSKTLTTGKN